MIPEMSFFWIAVGCYGFSSFSYIIGMMARKEAWFNLGMALSASGLICHVATMMIRWILVGVFPFLDISEALSTCVLIAVLILLVIQFSSLRLKAVGVLVMPVCFVLMGWAGTLIRDIGGALPPPMQSKWLWAHVVGAATGFSAVLTAAAFGLLFLLKEHRSGGIYDRIPDPGTLDEYGFRFIEGGVVMLGLMLITGSLWARQITGSYWNWNPVEIWSLCTWLIYAAYLLLRLVVGRRRRSMAWFALLALGVMIVSYWGIPFVKGNFHAGIRSERP